MLCSIHSLCDLVMCDPRPKTDHGRHSCLKTYGEKGYLRHIILQSSSTQHSINFVNVWGPHM